MFTAGYPARHQLMRATAAALATLLLLVALASCSRGSGATPNDPAPTSSHLKASLSSGGVARTYELYVPASLAGKSHVPLVVVLHGGGGSGAEFEPRSGFDQLADSAGFVAAYPDSAPTPSGILPTWNAGACCGYAARERIDDVGFVRDLIAALSKSYPVDANQVYVAGYSNGGMLGYRIACQLADVVAGVAVQSATLMFTPCQPTTPVSLLHIHGTADTNVPIGGGQGEGRSLADYRPVQESVAMIAAADGCSAAASTAPDPTIAKAERQSWPGCSNSAVELVTVTGATHAWMNTSAQVMWTFLSTHARR